ncbi:hypothetical protein EX30DRAFT_371031 [Ascodesmis nigricans]|uniref:Uncharacterized protein n=1 Tax=Ascodesmis nigricans TaxID=341454 RepID=A0A4S2MYN9_9PEZI|nr:hypothetical protein EX30DRAFT_371031 [Ascodesmis nigricans]
MPLISRLPLPFSSVLSPLDLDLVQPPLPGGDVDKLGEVAVEKWRSCKPWLRGQVSLVGVEGGLGGGEFGDGTGWGRDKFWGYAAWWRDFWVDFGVAKVGGGDE